MMKLKPKTQLQKLEEQLKYLRRIKYVHGKSVVNKILNPEL
jgi:hypothetical protein